ncbi:F-box protein [Cardamine amara subsp. amara]|uniref:F-box protein n=1 Tax=Cardamine amara subsp. amara TaxID=228776 RepID=A0ABD1AXQ1_CARAN
MRAREYVDHRLNIALTVSGEVLKVANAVLKSKRWFFCISKMNPIKRCWEVIDSLGDEALILDMGITVVAKDITGIKRNSIYFSGLDCNRDNPDHIFVFDLTTHKIEPLPPSVFSSILFYNARWFFPGLSGY